jgi:hypothetical protein
MKVLDDVNVHLAGIWTWLRAPYDFLDAWYRDPLFADFTPADRADILLHILVAGHTWSGVPGRIWCYDCERSWPR